jgi:predicted permease
MSFLETLGSDVRYAARTLHRAPGFTALAVLIIALGIGANTAIFSLVSAVLLKPLPFVEPDELVFLWEDASAVGGPPAVNLAPATYVDWQERSRSFEDMAAFDGVTYNLTGDGEPARLSALRTMPNLLSILGMQALVGRTFAPGEVAESSPVVVLSESSWIGRFGADPGIVGRELVLDGSRYTVIGVVPSDFRFPAESVDVFMPTAFTPQELAQRSNYFLFAVARLAPGVTPAAAQSELSGITGALATEIPELRGRGATVATLREQLAREARPTLLVLLGAVGVLLLIACANLANLLLARSAGRNSELALRKALGADGGRVMRQLLTEAGVLAAAGVVLGLALAISASYYLVRLVPNTFPEGTAPDIDWRVLAFTASVSLGTILLFAAGPAWMGARGNLNATLKKGAGRGNAARAHRLRNTLVVAEISLTVVLLTAAGLLLRSYVAVLESDPGFDPDGLLIAETVLPSPKYDDFGSRRAFYERVLGEVRALPGVSNAGYVNYAPLTFLGGRLAVTIEGRAPPTPETVTQNIVSDRVVTPGYLETLGLPLTSGRRFDERDIDAAARTVMINESMAAKYWPNENAVGKRFRTGLGDAAPWLTVIGVVGDVRQMGLDVAPEPELYLPASPVVSNAPFFRPQQLLVRTSTEPLALANAVRDAIWRVDSDQPVSSVRSFTDIFDAEVASRNTQLTLVGAFAVLALVLAAVGLYGVLSYTVAERRREIGLRMALGAERGVVARRVLAGALGLACLGLVVGVGGALALGGLLESFLFEVRTIDPLTFVLASALLLLVSAVASYVPARRAATVDPMAALRDE